MAGSVVAVLALGSVLIPGVGVAYATDVHVCSATGTFDRATTPDGVVIWSLSADGTCTSSTGTVSIHMSGRWDNYASSATFDTPCGSPQRAIESPNMLSIYYATPDGTVISPQFWEFQTTRAFTVWSTAYTPHPVPYQVIGSGSSASRIFLQCPGTPTARFDFSFAA